MARRKKDNGTIYTAGIATCIDGLLSNIKYLEGTKSEIIQFINDEYLHRYIDSNLKAKIVVNLCFDKDEFLKAFDENNENQDLKNEYKKNLEFWYTLEELQEMEAITLV